MIISYEEMLDLVDEHDQVIGTILRSEVKQQGLHNIRGVQAFIQNSQGQLLTPTRSQTMAVLPGGLDFSISGCVQSGESYLHGFAREAREEMNVAIEAVVFKHLYTFNPYHEDSRSFSAVYLIKSDIIPEFNKEEFSTVEWLYPQEILDRLNNGASGKYLLEPVIKRFFL